ncbi:MAG: putative COPII-coated vesicle protein SurF4/Erv29 [Olpidium bornovanus]|uniref:COPII-coated vesicle protein SurF4/Erv29 n=1 Tax=Olpidium bornovanus TaxID=278681 RepID=A0A8H7ZX51_9FUNG|nr:MAG: putative COPII-coated vesicle protein SurF4/Erv29 [Olpidium bornovanus]
MNDLRKFSRRAEGVLDRLGSPLKPYIPAIARFLLVVTFLEDSLRIFTQWGDQVYYLTVHRGMWGTTMVFCSTLAIARKWTEYAVAGLFGVVVSQSLGYGLIFDTNFFLRNLSVLGGLLMLLSESLSKKKKSFFAGLPHISDTNKSTYFQLTGRILLVFLFLSFIFAGDMTLGRIVVSIVGFVACVMVVIGLQTKLSAMFLVLFLSGGSRGRSLGLSLVRTVICVPPCIASHDRAEYAEDETQRSCLDLLSTDFVIVFLCRNRLKYQTSLSTIGGLSTIMCPVRLIRVAGGTLFC